MRLPPAGAPAIPDQPQAPEDADRLAEAEALRRAREVELAEQRARAEAAELQLAALRNTLSFGLGHALVEARTLRGLLRLPARLVELWRNQRAKRGAGAVGAEEPAGALTRLVAEARARREAAGADAARAWLVRRPGGRPQRARALAELALDCAREEPDRAASLALEAARLAPGEPRLRVLARLLHERGAVRAPARLLARLPEGRMGGDRAMAAALALEMRQLEGATATEDRPPRRSGRGGRVLIVAPASPLPDESLASLTAGHAHRVATAAGLPVTLALPTPEETEPRPRPQAQEGGDIRVRLPARPDLLAEAIAPAVAEAGLLHLVASGEAWEAGVLDRCRAAGVPCLAELARPPAWALRPGSERGEAARLALRALAERADLVTVRSAGTAELLDELGIDVRRLPDRISAPAGPDGEVTADLARELAIPAGAPVLACVMPLVDDPGIVALPDLLEHLPEGWLLLLAGSGPARARIEAAATAAGTLGRVRFAGPLLPGDLLPTLDLARALLLPRREPATIAADPLAAAVAARTLGLPLLGSAVEARWAGESAGVAVFGSPDDVAGLLPPPPRDPRPPEPDTDLAALYRTLLFA